MNRKYLLAHLVLPAVLVAPLVSLRAHAEDEAPAASPEPAPTPKPKPATRKVAPKAARAPAKPAPPPGIPPSVTLAVSPAPFPQPWTMRVENTGDIPLRLLADARLLSLEVTAPDAKASVTCDLPAGMRPAGDGSRQLVVPPKRAYAETFDPRLYCFGDREASAMIAGATIVAHLGFPVPAARARSSAPLTGPFVLAPLEGIEPRVSAAKEIIAAPLTLDAATTPPSRVASDPSATSAQAGGAADAGAASSAPARFAVAMTPWVDTANGANVEVTVTVTNATPATMNVRLRPAALSFEVSGPSGTTSCGWGGRAGAPIRELMTPLAPSGHSSTAVLLDALCPNGTFDVAGLYSVRVSLDPTRLTGEGAPKPDEIPAKLLSFVRVHQSRNPASEERPKLQAP